MKVQPPAREYTPVPRSALQLFRMCWQLEQWLRTIVYVELRAHRVDWETPIRNQVRNWPPHSLTSDKRLHHMSTPHQAALSYLTFGQLWDVISSSGIWPIFAPYFPPKDNVDIRIAEVKAMRNRVAHFREPHPHDIDRLKLFLRDIEAGIRRFCCRYTVGKIPTNPADDPVSQHLEEDWTSTGHGIELMRPHGWLYASGRTRMNPRMNARLQMHFHEDYSAGSLNGVIYRVTVMLGNQRERPIDAVGIFNSTKRLHEHIIHIHISPTGDELSATIPAILGAAQTADIVTAFLRAGLDATYSWSHGFPDRDKLEWPEYVLWPTHMLTFFCDEITEPILEIPDE